MTEDDIINAACEKLASLSPRPNIVWENQHWSGDDDTLMIVESIPGRQERRALGHTHEFYGIFQVTVRVLGDSGTNEALIIARKIQDLFYNTDLAGADVTHYPHRLAGYSDGGSHYRMPVQVRYRGFLKPA